MRTQRANPIRRRSREDVALLSVPYAANQPVEHLIIGQVVAPHGVRGELRLAIKTGEPDRFLRLHQVLLGPALERFAVQRVRLHEGQALLKLEGLEDRSAAEAWRGAQVYVSQEEALPLAEDEYYYHQIVGLTAVTLEGETLGRVTEVLPTGANDVYVVRGPQGEILLPAIKGVIVRIDLAVGQLVVRLIEGLR